MSRIAELFKKKPGILSIFCTAGYPAFDSTLEVMSALQEHGADMIELGIPYSDPLADGPVIQESNAISIANGMNIKRMFDQLQGFRNKINIPVLLMGYLNPVLQYGFEKFCREASILGIDGLILPDLPPREFELNYSGILREQRLDFIFLITPETNDGRVRMLDSLGSGFLYAVSSSSVTGQGKNIKLVLDQLERLAKMKLRNPIVAGFGISNASDFKQVCQIARGAIIGTAYIRALSGETSVNKATKNFLSSILGG